MLDRSSRSCRRRRKMGWRRRSRRSSSRRRRSDQRGLLGKRQLCWRGGGGGGDVRGRNSVRTMGHGIWVAIADRCCDRGKRTDGRLN